MKMDNIFFEYESKVHSYILDFPTVFEYAKNALLYSDEKAYIDFLSGAGSLNFGHNHPYIKQEIMKYLHEDKIIQGLDLATTAKQQFLKSIKTYILEKHKLKIFSCGPTGANAIEAALKLARKYTGRDSVWAFMGSFHGMSLGALSISSKNSIRKNYASLLQNVIFMPYEDSLQDISFSLEFMEMVLTNEYSGIEKPACIILETVQAEGGIHVASDSWLQKVEELCSRHGILFIIDDIQAGVGRTGTFFSFERAGIKPDIVVLSKSLSGIGLPLSVILMKKDLDVFESGEHNGTFRGNQLAFIGCNAVLNLFYNTRFKDEIEEKSKMVEEFLTERIKVLNKYIEIRGIGMIWGIDIHHFKGLAKAIQKECYNHGLIIERCGPSHDVIKILPPLTIEVELLHQGLMIIEEAIIKLLLENTYK